MAKGENGERQPLPPYVSYRTFDGVIQKFKESVLPNTVDTSVLSSYAGSVARQIITALKYLNLINETGKPTEKMIRLHKVYDTPEWQQELSDIMFDAYHPVIGDLNLDAATPAELDAKFKAVGAEGEVLDKCVGFFVSSMKAAGRELSPHIVNRPRKRPEKRGRPKKPEQNVEVEDIRSHVEGSGGSVKFSFPIPAKPSATLFLPSDLTVEDWTMVDAMMRAYIDRRRKTQEQERP